VVHQPFAHDLDAGKKSVLIRTMGMKFWEGRGKHTVADACHALATPLISVRH